MANTSEPDEIPPGARERKISVRSRQQHKNSFTIILRTFSTFSHILLCLIFEARCEFRKKRVNVLWKFRVCVVLCSSFNWARTRLQKKKILTKMRKNILTKQKSSLGCCSFCQHLIQYECGRNKAGGGEWKASLKASWHPLYVRCARRVDLIDYYHCV